MTQKLHLLTLGIALAALCAGPGVVSADETSPEGEPSPPHPAVFAADEATVDEAVLADARGGAASHQSEIRAVGTMTDVTVSDVLTGHNLITDGALAGASGVPMFIQNSGNGVLIQNSVILNLAVQ